MAVGGKAGQGGSVGEVKVEFAPEARKYRSCGTIQVWCRYFLTLK